MLALGETPQRSRELFTATVEKALGGPLPESIQRILDHPEIAAALFDPETEPIMLSQDDRVDYIAASTNNLYAPGVTLEDVTDKKGTGDSLSSGPDEKKPPPGQLDRAFVQFVTFAVYSQVSLDTTSTGSSQPNKQERTTSFSCPFAVEAPSDIYAKGPWEAQRKTPTKVPEPRSPSRSRTSPLAPWMHSRKDCSFLFL